MRERERGRKMFPRTKKAKLVPTIDPNNHLSQDASLPAFISFLKKKRKKFLLRLKERKKDGASLRNR